MNAKVPIHNPYLKSNRIKKKTLEILMKAGKAKKKKKNPLQRKDTPKVAQAKACGAVTKFVVSSLIFHQSKVKGWPVDHYVWTNCQLFCSAELLVELSPLVHVQYPWDTVTVNDLPPMAGTDIPPHVAILQELRTMGEASNKFIKGWPVDHYVRTNCQLFCSAELLAELSPLVHVQYPWDTVTANDPPPMVGMGIPPHIAILRELRTMGREASNKFIKDFL
jgi:hypothetical protein